MLTMVIMWNPFGHDDHGDHDDDGDQCDHGDHDDDGDQCDHVGPMWEVRLMSAGTASGRCFRVSET